MYSTESPPANDKYPERDVDASDAERLSSNRVNRQRPRAASLPSGFKTVQLKSARPPISRRIARSVAGFFFAVLIGAGGTLAWQSYSEDAKDMFRSMFGMERIIELEPISKLLTAVDPL